MEKIFNKLLICILCLFILINIWNAISYADDNFDLSKYGNDATSTSTTLTEPTKTVAGIVVGAIRIAGTGVALIVIAIIGIKYMIASPGERADLKKSSIQYVIGAVIVFGSAQILDILVRVLPSLVSTSST